MIYHGREAASIENESLRVTVLREGGHIAEILHKASGEAAAGLGVHGEASVAPYSVQRSAYHLILTSDFPLAQVRFERIVELRGVAVNVREVLESRAAFDRPIGWTQHVTLGPPFLEPGVTEFQSSATKSRSFETAFGAADYIQPAADFDWPMAPRIGGDFADLRVFNPAAVSSSFTTHLMDPQREDAFFTASHRGFKLRFGYRWKPSDFPWLGIWEENRSRTDPPWNGETIACGMEFGVSPMPETRRHMVDRGSLFGVPGYRWLPARSRLEVRYSAGFEAVE